MPARSLALNLSLCFLTFASCFLLLEIAFRTRQFVQGVPFFQSVDDFSDPELGWKGRFVAGNLSRHPKILFLGDSFTEGLGIPDSKLYFSVAAAELGAEAFAYGGKGYGNLQEYLALKRLLPQVQPDLIVLQLCVNDFLNNSWELERLSYMQNALLPRPYLQEGKIEMLFPRRFPHLRMFLDSHSRIAHVAFARMELRFNELARQKKILSIEERIVRTKGKIPEFTKAVETTAEILAMLLREAGKTPVVAFEADEIPPYHAEFRRISENLGLPLFPEIASTMMEEEKKRHIMRLEDNVHWNEAGHRVAGLALAAKVRPLIEKLQRSSAGTSTENQP